jgi:hypothetical protein
VYTICHPIEFLGDQCGGYSVHGSVYSDAVCSCRWILAFKGTIRLDFQGRSEKGEVAVRL